MDLRDLVFSSFVIMGLCICVGAVIKGFLSLFTKTHDDNAGWYWDVDWRGLVIAGFIFYLGLMLLGWIVGSAKH